MLDVPAIAEQLGRDLTIDSLKRRLRCSACGCPAAAPLTPMPRFIEPQAPAR